MPADQVTQSLGVVNVALDELRAERGLAMTGRQVVVDDDAAPGPRQQFRGVAADVAGATGDEYGAQGYLPIEK